MSGPAGRGAPDAHALLRLDRQGSGALPLHEQVYRQLRARIESGALAGGSRLPAARVVAAELGVARNTVDAALLRLQEAGLVVRRAGAGTVVAEGVAIMTPPTLIRFLRTQHAGRDTLKVYVIAAQAAVPGDDVVGAALRTVLAPTDDPRPEAMSAAACPAEASSAERARIGVLIVEVGHHRTLLTLGSWQTDGLLQLRGWTGPAGGAPRVERLPDALLTPGALAVFMHEAGAWLRYADSLRDADADAGWRTDVLRATTPV